MLRFSSHFFVLVVFLFYFSESCASSEKGRVLLLSYSDIPTAAAVGTTRGYNSVAAPPSHSGYIVSWFALFLGRFLPRSINLSHTSNKFHVVTVGSSN
jgi:hypothetical protein